MFLEQFGLFSTASSLSTILKKSVCEYCRSRSLFSLIGANAFESLLVMTCLSPKLAAVKASQEIGSVSAKVCFSSAQ